MIPSTATPLVAIGSVPGRPHLLVGKPNQDAVAYLNTPELTIAVICDGCSSGGRSEVGANLAAPLMVEAIRRAPRVGPGIDYLRRAEFMLEIARRDVLGWIDLILNGMAGQSRKVLVEDFFLFTVVAAVITPTITVVASIGDGYGGIDGTLHTFGPFENNAPPYLAYDGLVHSTFDTNRALLRFRIHAIMATRDIEHVVLASDGVADLKAAIDARRTIPHTQNLAGPFERFWKDEALFRNPDMLRRRLAVLSPPPKPTILIPEAPVQPPILTDDTTIASIWLRKDEAQQ